MRLSAPVYRLKRKARLLSRKENISLHKALDRIAAGDGFRSWSQLAAKASASMPAGDLYARLSPGDLVLVGARPGHGKTLMGLRLAVEAMKAGNPAGFFTLEYGVRDVLDRLAAIGADPAHFGTLFKFDDSDAVSADYIIARLASAPRGALAVVDYLQLLDQNRDKPPLMVQVRALKCFARERGLTIVFLSQIDRSYDPSTKPFPSLADIRLLESVRATPSGVAIDPPLPHPIYLHLDVEARVLIEIKDDVIWAKHLKSSPALYNAVTNLAEEETIRLSVDGIVGKWAKMRTGVDGRPTLGIKPVGAMATVWKRLQERRGEKVRITWPDDDVEDAWLRMADLTFEEWYTAEDEEAFGDLQPL